MINLKNVKIIVSEIDGIITEGLWPTDAFGRNVLFKEYYYKDFEAINQIKKYFKFAFLAKDNAINYAMAQQRNIPFFWHETDKKHITLLKNILPRYKLTVENVIYIGSSYSDEKVMNLVNLSACPADSPKCILNEANVVLNTSGGCGVLVDFYDSVIIPNLSSI